MKHLFAGINRNPGNVSLVLSAASAMCKWKKSSYRFFVCCLTASRTVQRGMLLVRSLDKCEEETQLQSSSTPFPLWTSDHLETLAMSPSKVESYIPGVNACLVACRWCLQSLRYAKRHRREGKRGGTRSLMSDHKSSHNGSRGKQGQHKRTLVLVVVKWS